MFWPFLSEAQARRMSRAYGVMLHEMLGQVRNEADMGRSFGAGFTEIEARWMREHEWAQTPEDCLWRRRKLGLHRTKEERADFAQWRSEERREGTEWVSTFRDRGWRKH